MEPQRPSQHDFARDFSDHEEINGNSPPLTRSSRSNAATDSPRGISLARNDDDAIEGGDAERLSSREEQAKAQDANLRCVWDGMMKDYSVAGRPHRRVAVLMISWTKTLDDLQPMEEVNALEDVWRNLFHYEVVKQEIVEGKRPGIQLAKHLVDFVHKYEGDSSLLIVYYAGHGIPGEPGELTLAGTRVPNKKHSKDNAAAWHESEHIIRDAEADVLLIFDCCYAGNLLSHNVRSYYQTRSYETLAACGRGEVTNFPGADSFTSALIWALKKLVEEKGRFTVSELQTRIMNGAPNFPKRQFVPLLERYDPCDQRLILAPLPSGSEAETPVSVAPNHAIDLRQNSLDLRFFFPKPPNEEEIKNLASRLKRDMMDNHIGARSIVWIALKNTDLIRIAADKFMSLRHTRNRPPFQTAQESGGEKPTGHPLCSPTPPGSHSSDSNISESQHDFQCTAQRPDSIGDDLTTIATNDSAKSMNQRKAEDNVQPRDNRYRYRFMYAMRRLYPVFKIALLVSLSAGAWYTIPFWRLSPLKRWTG